jgi:hypothetical protein
VRRRDSDGTAIPVILSPECLEMRTPGMILLTAPGMSPGLDQGKARPGGHRGDGEQERNEAANQVTWHAA